MALSISASTWNDELGSKSDYILKAILSAKTLQKVSVDKRFGITGNNQLLPKFESTTPWQSASSCGFTSSGTTSISQMTITTVPVQTQEQICLKTLETYFTSQSLPGTSQPETWELLKMWTDRKIAYMAVQLESALWQSKTTYTNATHLKHFNGFISTIDAASDEVIATNGGAGTALTTSTVKDAFAEIIFGLIPSEIADTAQVYCGYDTFRTLVRKLSEDNAFNYFPNLGNVANWELTYPGTNTKIIALPGLNNNNAVDSGSLPALAKNRIIACDPSNLVVAMNAENDASTAKVWYSDDDDVFKFSTRFHIGIGVKYTDQVVIY
jgi:hypothetical protein